MVRDIVTRDSDGKTLDIVKTEAEEHEIAALAKRVIGVDSSGVIVDANLIKFDPSDAQPIYIGINVNADASDGDTDWTIYKYTYSGSDATIIQKKTGSWTGRAALF